ncbi:retrotransposon protein, putative, ty1-copia subclass [Tanacetum coccineum]|uniref:Retrotransposon protein, putative, ty1-copia subclass n=1 Tax=Tanacetum coccineum TaxID=301880 RepID=A0ABQ5D7V5_9ASTR
MKCYLDTLERLGYAMPKELGVSLIQNSLNEDYDQLVQNYNMHSMGKMLAELHAMLKLHEKDILKKAETPIMLAIHEGRIQKDKKKKPEHLAKDSICHHCKDVGDWRRNCPSYHVELKKRKNANVASTSGIFTIELYAFPNKTWVYDTGCGTHICNTSQGLRESRKLKHGALSLYMGNGMRAAVEAIRSFDLILPSGLIIVLDNCHFAPTVTRGVVSISHSAEAFPHQVERAKDLLGLIHTDVCGPFGTVPREGTSYFITFIDDFSRYGFVYLMKHKHEVFETFKVFQNEVENQLGKKIKAIRSDRGGENLSREFVNHIKSCGILSQLTPPYTPQHNGVSKRRNQTLLDMVRSMMNLTTLPKSFWGYALETVARILNMVLTKKVDKMPYEIWHGKSPKLSYLRVWGCEALMKRDTLDKLDSRSIKCIFVEASGIHGLLEISGSDKGLELIQEEDTQHSENTSK